jgi:hypothetical protein
MAIRPIRRSVQALAIVSLLNLSTIAFSGPTQAVPGTVDSTGSTVSSSAGATVEAAGENGETRAPYLGWSSWSLQSTRYPGVNTKGDYSWLTQQHVLEQADVMAEKLKVHGYEYVNLDAGWWRQWDWTPEYDQYGRYAVDQARFPDGMQYTVDHIHDLGLKAGLYVPVGLEKGAYDDGDFPIEGSTTGCTTHDVVYPDLRTTNG